MIRKTLKPVAADIKASTPVDEGHLRDATRIAVTKTKPDSYISGAVGWFFDRRTDAVLPQGLAIETGNERVNPDPVIRPAFRRHANRMVRTFTDLIDDELRRAARRLTRKLGQGKLRIR